MATLLSYALTTKADVKESLGIASSDTTKDNLIIRKINQATRAIENYCGRRFALTTYTDVEYAATNTNQIILRQRPITTFTDFSIRDSSLNYSSFENMDSHLYFVDTAAGVVDLMFTARGGWNRYKFTYTAGYGTIPEDLAEACATLAAFYVNNADGSDVGLSSKREGQREVKFATATQNFIGILQSLGLDGILESYANNPIMTNR
jgi:hypothetical protein